MSAFHQYRTFGGLIASVVRWIAATALGIGLALAVQHLIALPDIALVPVALSLSYGFENLFVSKRLRGWWSESA